MITGVVTTSRAAVVQVMVRGAHSRDVPVDTVIDTGFTGFLTLPPTLIAMLGLTFAGTTRATLGDGSTVSIDVFEATVVWDNHDRLVTVLAAQGGALVGMAMLFGYRLLLEGADGGAVQIEALP
jgi:clan AA aspartic protease